MSMNTYIRPLPTYTENPAMMQPMYGLVSGAVAASREFMTKVVQKEKMWCRLADHCL